MATETNESLAEAPVTPVMDEEALKAENKRLKEQARLAEKRQKLKEKLLMEAEVQAEVEKEVAVKSQVITDQRNRKLSPEEIAVRDDPEVVCVFTNLEFKGASQSFSYGGRRFKFEDGEHVTVPLCVMEHLNSLGYPVYKSVPVEPPKGAESQQGITQQTISVRVGTDKRFNMSPVDPVAFAEAVAKKRGANNDNSMGSD